MLFFLYDTIRCSLTTRPHILHNSTDTPLTSVMSVMYANADDSFFKEHIWTESKIKGKRSKTLPSIISSLPSASVPNRDVFNPYPHIPPIRSRGFTLSSSSAKSGCSPLIVITGKIMYREVDFLNVLTGTLLI